MARWLSPRSTHPTLALHVIACDKRGAFAQGSVATKQSCFLDARRGGLLRFARNDGRENGALAMKPYPAYSAFFAIGGCGRPKSGAAESWPISTMPRRMARVRVK